MTNPNLRSQMLDRFTLQYDGMPSTVFNNAIEFSNFTTQMRRNAISFRTKIVKHKRRGRQFIVMLLDTLDGA
jgi:hypothetical protein